MSEFIDIVGFESLYAINEKGDVWSHKNKKVLKPYLADHGYYVTHFSKCGRKKTCYIHRLIMLTFTSKPDDKSQINHKNGIKTDNRIENLEWVTNKENSLHAIKIGLVNRSRLIENARRLSRKYGKRGGYCSRKLSAEQVKYIRMHHVHKSKEWGAKALAVRIGVCQSVVQNIVLGKTYRDISQR